MVGSLFLSILDKKTHKKGRYNLLLFLNFTFCCWHSFLQSCSNVLNSVCGRDESLGERGNLVFVCLGSRTTSALGSYVGQSESGMVTSDTADIIYVIIWPHLTDVGTSVVCLDGVEDEVA